jgi:hypothetical protein
VLSAFQAVTAAQGSVAAASSPRCSGAATSPSSPSTIISAMTPSRGPPRVVAKIARAGAPPSQPWWKIGHTRWPTATRVTPGPTATTSPTPSETGIRGRVPVMAP